MAIDKEKEKEIKEEIKQDYKSDIVSEEGMLTKLARSGLIALVMATTGSKVKNKKNILKYLDNDIVKSTAVAGISVALSEDDDNFGDIAAISLSIAAGSSQKYLRGSLLNGDVNLYKKLSKYAIKADDLSTKLAIFGNNFAESIVDSTKKTFNKNLNDYFEANSNRDSSLYSKAVQAVGVGLKTAGEILLTPVKKIYEHGFKEGINQIIESGIQSDTYQKYKFVKTEIVKKGAIFEGQNFEAIERMAKNMEIPGFESDNEPWHAFNLMGQDIFTVSEKEYKKFKKYQRIEKNTRFQDVLGRFTQYDEVTGKTKLRLDRIMLEEANYGKMLNQLATEFEDANRTDKAYQAMDDNQKERLFVKFLETKGFDEFVKDTYNKKDLISYGTIHKMLKDKKLEDLDERWQKYFIQGGRAGFIESDKENDLILGLSNNHLLKNFAFTNIVRKKGKNIVDQTAMDGSLLGLNVLGVLEENLVGHYKNMLFKNLNKWNPLKLIEHRNRSKNIYMNDYLKYTSTEDGYLYNGHRITKTRVKTAKTDEIYDIHTFYQKSDSNAYRYDSKKTTIDIINESYEVKRINEKNNYGYRDIYNIYKEHGLKKAAEAATESHINPIGFRYKNGKKRWVKNDEGYYKEGNIINDIIDMFSDKLDNKVLNTLRGKSSNRVTLSQLKTDNRRSEEIIKSIINYKLLNNSLESPNGAKISSNIMGNIIDELQGIQKNLENTISTATDEDYKNGLKSVNSALTDTIKRIEKYKAKGTFKPLNKKFEKTMQYFSNAYMLFASKGKKQEAMYSSQIYNLLSPLNDQTKMVDYIIDSMKYKNKSLSDIVGELDYKDDSIEEIKKFYNLYSDVKNKIITTATNKMKVSDNLVRRYDYINDISNNSSIFNQTYEARIGYEYNKFLKKYGLNSEELGLNSYKKFDEIYNNIYVPPEVEKAYKEGKSLVDHREKLDLVGALNNIKHSQFVQREEKYTSAVLIEDTIQRHLNSKSIMESIRKLIFKNNYEYTSPKYIERVGKEVREQNLSNKIIYRSANRGGKIEETTFNIFMKQTISGVQNALEVAGVERITNKKLGDSWLEQYKNFFKYRYVPLAGLVLGGIALNSFSDMIVPDSVPIVGNGILGVGTRAYATARVGAQYALKYTGGLSLLRSIDNGAIMTEGLISGLLGSDFLMDPSEMIDVYFKGKPIKVKKNRFWFTAGRQSGQGEEFDQYRPHLLYTLGNPSAGIYSNKVEKFFRKDFLLTKYPWYVLDPYKEEREAYEKFGLVHPKTEQLFKDIPVIGHFLSATVGEVIKPTQYIGEEQWRVGENLMINPNYDERNPYSPKYIEFKEPNRIVQSVFEAIEDIKTLSGLPGYSLGKITEMMFGASNPYQNDVVLSSLDKDTSYYRSYEKLQLGGMFGTTEGIRRLLDKGNSLGSVEMNPLTQRVPDYLPEYFSSGNNPYSSLDFAEYIIGEEFDEASTNKGIREELKTLRKLSMLAPKSSNYNELKAVMDNSKDSFTQDELKYFYETESYANEYGKREYLERHSGFGEKESIQLTIDEKISPFEFIADGKRYKMTAAQDDFNKLSKKYGSKKAVKFFEQLNNSFQEGNTYSFDIFSSATKSVGTDEKGDFLKVDHENIIGAMRKERNEFDKTIPTLGTLANLAIKFKYGLIASASPSTMSVEKILGKRTVFQEWSYETVQAPYFRDWDSPISSFIEPYFNLSSNNLLSFRGLYSEANSAFLDSSSATVNVLGLTSLAGAAMFPINKALGRKNISSEYKKDTIIQDEIEKVKFISGEKSYYNMTGNENLEQFKDMMNEQDAVFFEDLVNVSDEDERKRILETANSRMSNVLKTIWNRQAKLRYGDNVPSPYKIESYQHNKMTVTNVGAYSGNVDQLRNLLKSSYGYEYSKLDSKRQIIINSYRGGISQMEGDFISNKMYQQYNSQPSVISTTYPKGNINIIQTEG